MYSHHLKIVSLLRVLHLLYPCFMITSSYHDSQQVKQQLVESAAAETYAMTQLWCFSSLPREAAKLNNCSWPVQEYTGIYGNMVGTPFGKKNIYIYVLTNRLCQTFLLWGCGMMSMDAYFFKDIFSRHIRQTAILVLAFCLLIRDFPTLILILTAHGPQWSQ